MKEKGYNHLESVALYYAEKSVGKSSPIFIYKVPKPENLAALLNDLKRVNEK